METINWFDIIDSFEADSCVLFIGPYAFQNKGNQSIDAALFDYLELEKVKENNHDRVKRYYQDDGLFLFKKEGYQDKIAAQIKKFYQTGFQPNSDILAKIAEIPFSLIVNLTPDKFLQNTFENPEIQMPFYHDFYDKNGAIQQEYIKTTGGKPLIYNLLGYIGKEESLILTHDNLFDYLESVFAKNTMHDDLKAYIQNAHAYIFLGLPIDKWYTQLLLRLLKLDKKSKNELERLSATKTDKNQVIYKDQFHFNIKTKTTGDFINELHAVCAEEKLLKTKKTGEQKPVFDVDEIKKIVADADLKYAMEMVESMLNYYQPKSNDLLKRLTLIKTNLNELERGNNSGIVLDYGIEKNKITKRFLDFLEEEMSVQMEDVMI
jgi:hypothetical protein